MGLSKQPKEKKIDEKITALNLKGAQSGKAKKVLSVLALLLTLISLPGAILLVQQRQEIRKKAAEEEVTPTPIFITTPTPTTPAAGGAGCYQTCSQNTVNSTQDNCQANLVCGQRPGGDTINSTDLVCYNPACPLETDCVCNETPIATPTSSFVPVPTVTSTPGFVPNITPTPTSVPTSGATTPTATPTTSTGSGGGTVPTSTPTTAASSSTTTASAVTATPTMPVTGISLPTFGVAIGGGLAFLLGLALLLLI